MYMDGWLHSSAHAFETELLLCWMMAPFGIIQFTMKCSTRKSFVGNNILRRDGKKEKQHDETKRKEILFIIKRFDFHECFITPHFQEYPGCSWVYERALHLHSKEFGFMVITCINLIKPIYARIAVVNKTLAVVSFVPLGAKSPMGWQSR